MDFEPQQRGLLLTHWKMELLLLQKVRTQRKKTAERWRQLLWLEQMGLPVELKLDSDAQIE